MVAKALAAPSTEDVKHINKTVKLPVGVKSFEVWGRTIIKMDKYATNKWSFAELVAFHMWIGKLCIIPVGSLGSLQHPL